jgi:hypothetical protein
MGISPEWVSALASTVAAVGIVFAFGQLRTSKNIAQLQFEDNLAKEYRDLAARIPSKALLGHALTEMEYMQAFDEFYRFVGLSNEQVFLRQRGRISHSTWRYWCKGIQSNLSRPSFNRAWTEIQNQCDNFQELRRLDREEFERDPKTWER